MATRNENLPPLPRLNVGAIPGAPPRPGSLPALPKGWRGTWNKRPDLDPDRWKVGRVGKGPRKGKYIAKPVRRPRTPPAQGVGTGTGVTDPLRGHPDAALLKMYENEPWAQAIIQGLRADQTNHQQFVSGSVLPWASGALTGLAQINQSAQDNFTGQANAAAQGMAQAGAAQPGLYQGTAGGAVTSPSAYQQAASAQGMANQASTMGQMAAWQGLMGTIQPTTYSQGQIAALSDYAKGLPELYARKRAERVDAIDKYLAEREQAKAELALEMAQFEETQRSNRVREAISATNSQTNAAIALGNLGIRAADSAADNAPEPTVDPNAVPYGFVLLPNGDVVRDPQVPQASASSGSGGGGGGGGGGGSSDRAPSPARGEYPPNKLRKEGYRPLPRGAGPKYRRVAVEATDGSLWYKPGASSGGGGSTGSGGSSSGSGGGGRNAGTLQSELRRLYGRDQDNGWEARYDNNPQGAAQAVAQWVVGNIASFGGKGRPVNETLLAQLLRDEIGGANVPAAVVRILQQRHFRRVNGRWVWK